MVELWYPTNASCVRTNAAGISYEEFSCIQPAWLQTTYLPYVVSCRDVLGCYVQSLLCSNRHYYCGSINL
jgi:hypothetical protein